MKLRRIDLHQFRNYHEQTFEFDDKLTIITGKNGVGKTNLLEAIYISLNGSSWRDKEADLVEFNQDWWRIDSLVDSDKRSLTYSLELAQKQISLNQSYKKRFHRAQKLPVVLFEPDQLNIIHGSPLSRRNFIDKLIINLDPSFITSLTKYERILRQRNNLLKDHRFSDKLDDMLFAWDINMVNYGAQIIDKRQQIIKLINQDLSKLYSELSGEDEMLELVYKPSFNISTNLESSFTKQLKNKQADDQLRGFSSVGPHRDDVQFLLNHKDAATTASRGEIRSIIYEVKRRELALVETNLDKQPIFLMDDLFSELDERRQQNIIKDIPYQTIVTTTQGVSRYRQIKL